MEAGPVVCLLGPSGCGKTTLLRLVAGFEEPDAGEIYLLKRLVSRPGLVVPPEQRHVGMVFQDYALVSPYDCEPEYSIWLVSLAGSLAPYAFD